jgi:hypothetical protein
MDVLRSNSRNERATTSLVFFLVHLEDSALSNHGGRAAVHGNQVFQNQVGGGQTRNARTTLLEGAVRI